LDNLGDIRLFVEAANLGSLSAAGRRLGLSPAAASARLAKLEAALHVRLFERTTRELRLTNEGSLYLTHCQDALHALDDAHAALQAGQGAVRGRVRVSATSDFGRNVLKGWLDEFTARHPDVLLSLTLADSLANLVHDDIDLAIRFGMPADDTMVARRLAPNRRVLCAAPSYIAQHGLPTHPNDLQRFDCIVMSTSGATPSEWRFEKDGESVRYEVPVATARDTNDGAIARAWAVDGHGIAMKSMWDIGSDLAAGRLVVVMPQWRTPEAPVHALLRHSRYMPTRVRAMLDFLAERFTSVGDELEALLASAGSKPAPR
jgi:DNA-binding transcriptional LysR family regulator